MHQYQSTSSIRRLRLAAVLMCGRCVLSLASVGVLIGSLISNDIELTILAVGLIALTVGVTMLQWFAAAGSHCPLCRARVLGTMVVPNTGGSGDSWAVIACRWRWISCSESRTPVPIATSKRRWKSAGQSGIWQSLWLAD